MRYSFGYGSWNVSGSLKDINLFDVMLPWGTFCCMFWIIVSSALMDYSTLPFRVWAPSLFLIFQKNSQKTTLSPPKFTEGIEHRLGHAQCIAGTSQYRHSILSLSNTKSKAYNMDKCIDCMLYSKSSDIIL